MFKKLLFGLIILIPCVFIGAQEVKETKHPKRIYMFSATWCGPCQVLKRFLKDEEIQKSIKKYDAFVEVDIDKYPETARKFGVKTIPVFFIVETIEEKNIVILYKWTPTSNWTKNEQETQKYLLTVFEKFAPDKEKTP